MLRYRWALIKLTFDCKGQDLIEYALTAGFVAVLTGAIMPGAATMISSVFSTVTSHLVLANHWG